MLGFPVIVEAKFPAIVDIVLMLPAIAEQEQTLLVVVELSFPVVVELALLVVVALLLLFVVYARLNCLLSSFLC